MDANKIIHYLIQISKAKYKLMEEILSITKQQSSCTNQEKLDQLMHLIKLKQEIIEKINKFDKEFTEKFDLLKKVLKITSLDEIDKEKYSSIKELKLTVGNIMEMIEKIKEIEIINHENMNAAFKAVKEELGKVKQGIKVQNVYNKKNAIYGGVFIDKRK